MNIYWCLTNLLIQSRFSAHTQLVTLPLLQAIASAFATNADQDQPAHFPISKFIIFLFKLKNGTVKIKIWTKMDKSADSNYGVGIGHPD